MTRCDPFIGMMLDAGFSILVFKRQQSLNLQYSIDNLQ